jgi:hypothetical protein
VKGKLLHLLRFTETCSIIIHKMMHTVVLEALDSFPIDSGTLPKLLFFTYIQKTIEKKVSFYFFKMTKCD